MCTESPIKIAFCGTHYLSVVSFCASVVTSIIKTIVLLKLSPRGLWPKTRPVPDRYCFTEMKQKFSTTLECLCTYSHFTSSFTVDRRNQCYFPLSHMNTLPSMTYTLAFYPVSYNRDIWLLQSYCWESE